MFLHWKANITAWLNHAKSQQLTDTTNYSFTLDLAHHLSTPLYWGPNFQHVNSHRPRLFCIFYMLSQAQHVPEEFESSFGEGGREGFLQGRGFCILQSF